MFLTKMSESPNARILSLEKLANLLPSPLRPLHGKRAAPLALPDNIVCFCRRSATDLLGRAPTHARRSKATGVSRCKTSLGLFSAHRQANCHRGSRRSAPFGPSNAGIRARG